MEIMLLPTETLSIGSCKKEKTCLVQVKVKVEGDLHHRHLLVELDVNEVRLSPICTLPIDSETRGYSYGQRSKKNKRIIML